MIYNLKDQLPEFSWDFIEKHYPNYQACQSIADSDDLQKIVDDECTCSGHDDDASMRLMLEIAESLGLDPTIVKADVIKDGKNPTAVKLEAQKQLSELEIHLYHRALNSYILNFGIDENTAASLYMKKDSKWIGIEIPMTNTTVKICIGIREEVDEFDISFTTPEDIEAMKGTSDSPWHYGNPHLGEIQVVVAEGNDRVFDDNHNLINQTKK